jgi:DNA-directed RNA polymerase subunit RPC12/RpoP
MTTGAVQYSCPKCNNPLFFTFKVVDTKDNLRKTVNCPGCRTQYIVDLKIVGREAPP